MTFRKSFLSRKFLDMLYVAMVTEGSWSDKAIELLDSLTLCATWKVVMVMVEVRGVERSEVKIVDTTTDKDIDVAEQLVEEGVAEWTMEVCYFKGDHFLNLSPCDLSDLSETVKTAQTLRSVVMVM